MQSVKSKRRQPVVTGNKVRFLLSIDPALLESVRKRADALDLTVAQYLCGLAKSDLSKGVQVVPMPMPIAPASKVLRDDKPDLAMRSVEVEAIVGRLLGGKAEFRMVASDGSFTDEGLPEGIRVVLQREAVEALRKRAGRVPTTKVFKAAVESLKPLTLDELFALHTGTEPSFPKSNAFERALLTIKRLKTDKEREAMKWAIRLREAAARSESAREVAKQ